MSISDRLREVRKERQLSQEAFGALGGVTKKTQTRYELEQAKPSGEYLEALAKSGLDVAYILVGKRDPKLLGEDQRRLVDIWSGLDDEFRQTLMAYAMDLHIKAAQLGRNMRMRVGKDNTVDMTMNPTSTAVHEDRPSYGDTEDGVDSK